MSVQHIKWIRRNLERIRCRVREWARFNANDIKRKCFDRGFVVVGHPNEQYGRSRICWCTGRNLRVVVFIGYNYEIDLAGSGA
jgi:hypothetical protein